MKKFLSGAVALSALAAVAGWANSARAADVTYSEPTYSWSGIYIGGYVGAGATVGRAEADADFGEIGGFDVDFKGIGGEGILGGGLIGFNWQVSERFLLGVQGDAGWTDIEAELESAISRPKPALTLSPMPRCVPAIW